MFTHPGAKLLFMGAEFGQGEEWNFDQSLDWHLLEFDNHQGIKKMIQDLNILYKNETALHQKQFSADGFEWISYNDEENSVIAFIRKGIDPKDDVIVACNFTPRVLEDYPIGIQRFFSKNYPSSVSNGGI
jgi:1,4-alpha-glucan branching enzyme